MAVFLSNQKCRFSRPEQLQDQYIVDLRCSKQNGYNMKYSRPKRDCAVLVFEVGFESCEACRVNF